MAHEAMMPRNRRPAWRACALLTLCATISSCSKETAEAEPDLPADWKGAARIASFEQSECAGSPYDGQKESVDVSPGTKTIQVEIHRAHFRCSQPVEGYLRRNDGTLDVLVQPVDMSPETVAKCDCLYEIVLALPASTGTYDVTTYRRWDHLSGGDEPLFLGAAQVVVE